MNMEKAPWLNPVVCPLQRCVPRGGLWASFFDWLLGSGVEHLLVFDTLGAGGGGHLWLSPERAAPWEVDHWQHEVVLTHPSWTVRAVNSGLGLWGTGQGIG